MTVFHNALISEARIDSGGENDAIFKKLQIQSMKIKYFFMIKSRRCYINKNYLLKDRW